MKPRRQPPWKGRPMFERMTSPVTEPRISERSFPTRSFFFYRLAFYLIVAFAVREGVISAHRQAAHRQSEVLSSEFIAWSSTFESRLDRAMDATVATGDAE